MPYIIAVAISAVEWSTEKGAMCMNRALIGFSVLVRAVANRIMGNQIGLFETPANYPLINILPGKSKWEFTTYGLALAQKANAIKVRVLLERIFIKFGILIE
jgi:hypothetical protein